MSYKDLEIWKLARETSIEIHNMTLEMLPRFEMFEEGSQIRKSSKSCRATIVEGYGRRYYKNDFIKFLYYSLASNIETIDHLDTLYETKSLTDTQFYTKLSKKLDTLGKKLRNFIKTAEKDHISPR